LLPQEFAAIKKIERHRGPNVGASLLAKAVDQLARMSDPPKKNGAHGRRFFVSAANTYQ
jgi:hypothetical protein